MTATDSATASLRKLLPLMAAVAVLAGCGQMGPLYLPEQAPEGAPAETEAESSIPTEESMGTDATAP